MLGFQVAGSSRIGPVQLDGPRQNVIKIESNYAPRLDRVGSASGKVYAMDGVRYLNGDVMSFNGINFQLQGGNFMSNGPAFALGGDPYQFEGNSTTPTIASLRFAYRHNGSVNSVFFDGHGENLSADQSVDLNYYYPTGTKVSGAGNTNDKDFVGNTIR
jgi:prepilin-type processing-associated H-X9-DG protein